ncbi:putative lipoprotein [Burkholderia pseudomallei ABCPW 107]|nr:putative lipoprotein [Burkholderia pseudomallei ABCPW 107]
MHGRLTLLRLAALLHLLILLGIRACSGGLVVRSGGLLCLRGKRDQGSDWQDRKPRSHSFFFINHKIFADHVVIGAGRFMRAIATPKFPNLMGDPLRNSLADRIGVPSHEYSSTGTLFQSPTSFAIR